MQQGFTAIDRSADMFTGLHISPCAVKPAKKCWRISKKPDGYLAAMRCSCNPKASQSGFCVSRRMKSEKEPECLTQAGWPFSLGPWKLYPLYPCMDFDKLWERSALFLFTHTQNPGRSSTVDPWPRTQVEHRWNVYTVRWKAWILAQCGCMILHVSARFQRIHISPFSAVCCVCCVCCVCLISVSSASVKPRAPPCLVAGRPSDRRLPSIIWPSRAVYTPRCSESECKWSVNLSVCTMFY